MNKKNSFLPHLRWPTPPSAAIAGTTVLLYAAIAGTAVLLYSAIAGTAVLLHSAIAALQFYFMQQLPYF